MFLLLILSLITVSSGLLYVKPSVDRVVVDLSGIWKFSLDPKNVGFEQEVEIEENDFYVELRDLHIFDMFEFDIICRQKDIILLF